MTDEGLLKIFAREIGQHTENCPWEDCSNNEKDAAYRAARFLLAKAKPLIEKELLSQEGVKASFDSMIKREVEETLKEVNALIDKYIGNGEYNVYVPERGTIRGISADLGYVWKALKQELEALLQGKMPEAEEVTK